MYKENIDYQSWESYLNIQENPNQDSRGMIPFYTHLIIRR